LERKPGGAGLIELELRESHAAGSIRSRASLSRIREKPVHDARFDAVGGNDDADPGQRDRRGFYFTGGCFERYRQP
jgi:hypothetical protein